MSEQDLQQLFRGQLQPRFPAWTNRTASLQRAYLQLQPQFRLTEGMTKYYHEARRRHILPSVCRQYPATIGYKQKSQKQEEIQAKHTDDKALLFEAKNRITAVITSDTFWSLIDVSLVLSTIRRRSRSVIEEGRTLILEALITLQRNCFFLGD